jgi:purine-nucleoside phosphorylase
VPGTIHLRPHAEVAERVLLPGDPGRALRLAQQLVDTPKMLNHHRGLWGYTGVAADGGPLTIQSTGIGGPSTAVVAEELIALGARRLVRLGTCTADAALGALVIAAAALPEDGTSRALGATTALPADPTLLAALRAAAPDATTGPVLTADLFYDPDPDRWTAAGAVAVDLATAALFAVAARRRVAAASVLVVSRSAGHEPAPQEETVASAEVIEPEQLERAEAELGRVGAAALLG